MLLSVCGRLFEAEQSTCEFQSSMNICASETCY